MDLPWEKSEGAVRAGAERRAEPRLKVLWWAQLETAGERFACSVVDLAPRGARLRTPRSVSRGEEARLILPPFGAFAGAVMWTGDGHLGVEFAAAEHGRMARVIASGLNQQPS